MTGINPHPGAGRRAGPLDGDRSRSASRAVRGEAGACYANARRAVDLLDARGVPAAYVEGFAVDPVLPCAIGHAWMRPTAE